MPETDKETITSIIDSLIKINKGIENRHNEDKSKGEDFNIFSVMGVQTDEVKLHSALIAELLNPNGSHGQGDYFTKLFIEECCKKYNSKEYDWSSAKVNVEVSIGAISENLSTGGRLDILIDLPSSDVGIAIENKIYAGDQKKQLDRYHHYLKEERRYKNSELLYLTVDGHQASNDSASEDTEYSCISYSGNIIHWLERSIKERELPKSILEIIEQYIDVLKFLSGTKKVEKMVDEEKQAIIETLIKDNNLVLFEEYSGMIIESKNVLFKRMIESLRVLENEDLKLSYDENVDFSRKETGFDFDYKEKVTFSFVFDSSNFNQFYYGIMAKNIDDKMKLENIKDMKTASTYYCWDYFDKNGDFYYLTTQNLVKYAKEPQQFIDAVKATIEKMKEQIKEC